MEKLKSLLERNQKQFILGIGLLAICILAAAVVIYDKKPEGKAYYYENKMEAMLAQRTIEYLEQHTTMKQDDLEEMGDMAVKTYNAILASGTNEITEEHSAVIEEAIQDALYSYLSEENLNDADYEMLSAGISKIILDILLTELINSELAVNVNYQEEFNALTSSLQTQIKEIKERMAKLKVRATIRFNTDVLKAEINQTIQSSLEKGKNDLYENLGNEMNHSIEKQISKIQNDIIDNLKDGIRDEQNALIQIIQ